MANDTEPDLPELSSDKTKITVVHDFDNWDEIEYYLVDIDRLKERNS